jgi:hypothetical protein
MYVSRELISGTCQRRRAEGEALVAQLPRHDQSFASEACQRERLPQGFVTVQTGPLLKAYQGQATLNGDSQVPLSIRAAQT